MTSKNGCFKTTWADVASSHRTKHGILVMGVPDSSGKVTEPAVGWYAIKDTPNVMSRLCRYDRRMEDRKCDGCAKPWDIDYIKQNFGEHYVKAQITAVG